MPAGKYRFRVTIQSRTLTGAEPVESWSKYAELWAAQGKSRSSERIYGQIQREAHAETVFLVRYSATTRAITPEMRLVWDGRTHNITAAHLADGRREDIELVCVEVL